MNPSLFRRFSSPLFVVFTFAVGSGGAAAQQAASAGDLPSKAEFEAIYNARADSARMHFTHADAAFLSGMILHHSQALLMAGMAPTHGASPSVRTLCARIINAQKDEIATMRQWLTDRGQPAPEVQVSGLDLVVHGGVPMEMQGMGKGEGNDQGKGKGMDMSGMSRSAPAQGASATASALMPGMLTHAQMAQLEAARGADFDRLFLTGMIQHHGGAIVMVRDLFATPGAGEEQTVFKLANDIQVDQTTEIARMQGMLAALSPTSTP